MIQGLVYGTYTAAAWQHLRRDPEAAPEEIRRIAVVDGGGLVHFFFALEEFDFYAVVAWPSLGVLSAARHRLMAGGSFQRLHIDPLQNFHDLFPYAEGVS